MSLHGDHTPIWIDTAPSTDYDALDGGTSVDTVVVGGGIVGVTTAFQLLEAGQTVALVERDRIIEGVTGHTTAKLTSLHGLCYDDLLATVGEDRASQYAESNEAAIDSVESLATGLDASCDFRRAPAYTYALTDDGRTAVRREVEAARRLGLPASYTESTELPFDVRAAIRFDDQALFHPREYLLSLANSIAETEGGRIFEQTRVTDVDPGTPCRITTDSGEIVADDVVVATHFPIYDPSLYFTRLTPKRSYVLAVELEGDTLEGMYYCQSDPYVSVRPVPAADEPTVLIGGENHRTGHGGSTADRYRRLREMAEERFDVARVRYRWSTQDFVSVDGVPFVGPAGLGTDHVYVATGFGGWGLTNGTAAGLLLADLVRGRPNEWRDVYEPRRLRVSAAARDFLEHNIASAKHVADRYLHPRTKDAGGIAPGEGRVVDSDEGPVALSRDETGELHAVSAVCTHLGCLLEWNDGEASWDCPCHGSRFGADGAVHDTPAVANLERYDIADQQAPRSDRESASRDD